MPPRAPEGPPPPPVVQRLRIRYAKRGRLRFTSHRDFARAFERALRRADVPVAYSAGFTPHPRVSYLGAAPTGVGSEAEYLELGLSRVVDPVALLTDLDRALPDGLDLLEAVVCGPGSLADRLQASRWRIELPGVGRETAAQALEIFLGEREVLIERVTKDGRRRIDARGAVLAARAEPGEHAILEMVVRQTIPAVRPDDVLAALRTVAGLALDAPPIAVRLAQGPLDDANGVGDPLAADRDAAGPTTPS
jgi:radical SAM-linked protein